MLSVLVDVLNVSLVTSIANRFEVLAIRLQRFTCHLLNLFAQLQLMIRCLCLSDKVLICLGHEAAQRGLTSGEVAALDSRDPVRKILEVIYVTH